MTALPLKEKTIVAGVFAKLAVVKVMSPGIFGTDDKHPMGEAVTVLFAIVAVQVDPLLMAFC
jgi:hypothetical protein